MNKTKEQDKNKFTFEDKMNESDKLTLAEKAHDGLSALADNGLDRVGDRSLVQQQGLEAPQGRQLLRNLFQLWVAPQVQGF